MSFGMPVEPVDGSSTGYEIWPRTTDWIVRSPSPSARDWRNALSRFGPITPTVPASASTWHWPHLSLNSSLPRVVSPEPASGRPVVPQPVVANAAIRAAQAPASPRSFT